MAGVTDTVFVNFFNLKKTVQIKKCCVQNLGLGLFYQVLVVGRYKRVKCDFTGSYFMGSFWADEC